MLGEPKSGTDLLWLLSCNKADLVMKLTGQQHKQLGEAIQSAFPKKENLEVISNPL